jgi:quinol monooxygenase YgiN
VPTPTDGDRELLTVSAYMRAAAGKREELKAALEALIEPTKQENRYVSYDQQQGVEDPEFFTFYENWVPGGKPDAHLAAPHLLDFAAKMGDLLHDAGLSIQRSAATPEICPAARRQKRRAPGSGHQTRSGPLWL